MDTDTFTTGGGGGVVSPDTHKGCGLVLLLALELMLEGVGCTSGGCMSFKRAVWTVSKREYDLSLSIILSWG